MFFDNDTNYDVFNFTIPINVIILLTIFVSPWFIIIGTIVFLSMISIWLSYYE